MMSATAIFAQFDTGKAQECGTEIVVADQMMTKDMKVTLPGWSLLPLGLVLVLWALRLQVFAMRVALTKISGAFSAMRSDP